MTLDEYQQFTATTAKHASLAAASATHARDLVYPVLGLNGEAGEVAEKVKKLIRDDDGQITDDARTAIALELGDVLWYLATTARKLGVPLSEVARMNMEKLLSRRARGTTGGSGDNR
ncbi:MAG TPA: nucleoside triphosphate pyrophosphohydrolase family protein [Candidatus Paceibacterota bacterium]|nr:nucleoside triphosphate pyrophosphohydrolase family protein [Candidatus Paceibacterota bacterium]